MREILLTLTIFAISACGLFDYSHNPAQPDPTPKKWEESAKAECKKGEYEKDPNASYPNKPQLSVEEANFQLCVDRKVIDLKKKYRAKRDKDGKLLPNIGFNFGLVFGL